jgi:apolipoprotein N-acyltransferase
MRRPSDWPGPRPILGAMALGLAMSAGQAPLGVWWVSLPALAVLTRQIAACEKGGRWLGWFAGAGYFAGSLNWIYEPFLVDAKDYAWMAPFAVLLIAFGLGLFWGAAGWIAQRPRGARGGLRALNFATSLTAAELLRSYVLTGFPWALIGHIWIETPLAQAAALIGPLGLTALTCLAAAGLAALRLRQAALAVSLLAGLWCFGSWRLAQPAPPAAAHPAVVRLVQPNAIQSLKWDPAAAQTFFDRLLHFTAEAPRPDLVVWPETALPYLLERSPEVGAMIAAAGHGAPVAVGLQRLAGQAGYNSLAVIAPDASITARYDKWHLVPFGEYIPAGDLLYKWFGVQAFASQLGAAYSAGSGPAALDLGGSLGRVVPLICYEAIFPQDLRAAIRTGARPDWILQITNDAWFGMLTGPWQHLAQARLRAIEQGLPLARAANTGVSALIDARGRIVAELGLGQAGWLDVTLPAALPPTLYARSGDWPVAVFVALLWLMVIARAARRRA